MSTFAGAYIREPSDFMTVATEAMLIQLADDPATPLVPSTVQLWSQLSAPQAAALLAVINPIILRKEGLIDGYLRGGGYTAPADPATNAMLVEMAVNLTWNDLQYRKSQITREELVAANEATMRQLLEISSGVMVLVSAGEAEAEPPSGTVHSYGTSARTFSRETLEDM